MIDQLQEWDRQLFIYLNNLGIERFDAFWIFVTQEETWWPLYLVFAFLIYFAYKKRNAVITVIIGYLLSFLITFGLTRFIKASIARSRPSNLDQFKDLIRILQEPSYYSFPSGHTSSSMAITTYIVLMLRHKYKWVYVFYLWPILFATSRVYVGVHYPSDIAAGALLGVIIGVASAKVTGKVLHKKVEVTKLE